MKQMLSEKGVKRKRRGVRTPVAGLSLIEVLVVLAILAVLAGMLAPRMIKMIDRAYYEDERAKLETMATGLGEYVKEERRIPGANEWDSSIASKVPEEEAEIEGNTRGNARRFLIDPDFWSTGNANLPYVQGPDGLASRPNSPRFIVVSSIHDPLPTDSIDFDALWASPEGELPDSAPWTSWSGAGSDVNLQRIHLGSVFHRLLIQNRDDSADAKYSIDNGSLQDAPATATVGYFIDGTILELHDLGNSPSKVTEIIINEDMAYYYEQGMWQRDFMLGGTRDWIESLVEDLRYWIDENNYSMNDLNIDIKGQKFHIMAPSSN